MLSHLNKRVKAQSNVLMPLDQLLQLYTAPDTINFARNFILVYLEMGFARVSKKVFKIYLLAMRISF